VKKFDQWDMRLIQKKQNKINNWQQSLSSKKNREGKMNFDVSQRKLNLYSLSLSLSPVHLHLLSPQHPTISPNIHNLPCHGTNLPTMEVPNYPVRAKLLMNRGKDLERGRGEWDTSQNQNKENFTEQLFD